jgi:hypothetical protein
MSAAGKTRSIIPVAIAERGICANTASAGSWAIDRPPISLTRRPERAIASRAREHDAHCALEVHVGQGAKQNIDRGRRTAPAGRIVGRMDLSVVDHQVGPGRDHVDMVARELGRLHDLHHRHRRRAAEDLGDVALVVRRKMDDDDERHARVVRQRFEQLQQRRHGAGGAADADDREGRIAGLTCLRGGRRVGDRRGVLVRHGGSAPGKPCA